MKLDSQQLAVGSHNSNRSSVGYLADERLGLGGDDEGGLLRARVDDEELAQVHLPVQGAPASFWFRSICAVMESVGRRGGAGVGFRFTRIHTHTIPG